MGAVAREKDGAWYVFFNEAGERWAKRIRGGELVAKAAADKHNADKAARNVPRSTGPKGFDAVAEEWWASTSGGWADTTQKTRRTALDRLLRLLGGRDIRELDKKAIGLVAQKLCPPHTEHARATVTFTGDQLAQILAWAVENQRVKQHPCAAPVRGIFKRIARARCGAPKVHDAWTYQEAHAILAALRAPERRVYFAAALFALRTGCRIGELVALEWGDVNFEHGTVTFRQSKSLKAKTPTKGDKIRIRPLPSDVQLMLRHLKTTKYPEVFLNTEGRPWSARSLSSGWCKIRKTIPDVRPFKWHCWRHTFASWALDQGWSPGAAADFIGDTLEVFHRHYAHWIRGKHLDLEFFNGMLDGPHPQGSAALPGAEERRLVLLPPA